VRGEKWEVGSGQCGVNESERLALFVVGAAFVTR